MEAKPTITSSNKEIIDIVYIVDDLNGRHGWSTYALHLIEPALRAGYRVHAFVHKKSSVEIEGVTQYEFLPSPHSVTWNIFTLWKTRRRFKSLLTQVSPSVVHVIVEPYVQFWGIMRRGKYLLILTMHGTYSRLPNVVPEGLRRFISRAVFRRALSQVERIITVSDFTKSIFVEYAKKISVPHGEVYVVHNSIRLPSGLSEEVKSGEVCSVVTIGAVKRRKGAHLTIKYFSEWAKQRHKRVIYHVVGSYDDSSMYVIEVMNLAKSMSHEYFSVIFHGSVVEDLKKDILSTSNLYVHIEEIDQVSMDIEGFGIGIIEAALYGVPALVARGSATAEAVREGASGYIVDLGDGEHVLNTIDNLLINETLSPENIKQWAAEHTPDVAFSIIERLYKH